MPVSVDLPMPGEPPSSTSEPGTSPPPRTRSTSPMPVRSRGARAVSTSRRRTTRPAAAPAAAPRRAARRRRRARRPARAPRRTCSTPRSPGTGRASGPRCGRRPSRRGSWRAGHGAVRLGPRADVAAPAGRPAARGTPAARQRPSGPLSRAARMPAMPQSTTIQATVCPSAVRIPLSNGAAARKFRRTARARRGPSAVSPRRRPAPRRRRPAGPACPPRRTRSG